MSWTLNTFLPWAFGLVSIPILTWMYMMTRLLRDIRRDGQDSHQCISKLVKLHTDTGKLSESLNRGIAQLVHYQKWVYKAITKQDPPPYTGEADKE